MTTHGSSSNCQHIMYHYPMRCTGSAQHDAGPQAWSSHTWYAQLAVQADGAFAPCTTSNRAHPACSAVPFLVDHDASCIYMERIEGHSVKTLLHERSLQESGVQAGQALCVLSYC